MFPIALHLDLVDHRLFHAKLQSQGLIAVFLLFWLGKKKVFPYILLSDEI